MDDFANEADRKVFLHPNPVNDILYINGLNEPTKVTIYNILGAKIQENTLTTGENAISVHNLSKGSYILSIDTTKRQFIKN